MGYLEIKEQETQLVLKIHFQFPLWDTQRYEKPEYMKEINFQFPLWDTPILIGLMPFLELSIPFMGYCSRK